ncbi:MAG: hypothetical protein IJS78_01365 [Clostridia bacterium]|nr:hypothetical protein [Clostridia bacterium]
MTAAVVVFALFLAAGSALTLGGAKGGASGKAYVIVEGGVAAVGAAAAVVTAVTFGGSRSLPTDDPEYYEWAREAFSVYVKAAGAVVAVVFALGALRLLIAFLERKRPDAFGAAVVAAAPFAGAVVVFVIALFAVNLFSNFTVPATGEIIIFALGAAAALRALPAFGAVVSRRARLK